jgi:hypothetical protein
VQPSAAILKRAFQRFEATTLSRSNSGLFLRSAAVADETVTVMRFPADFGPFVRINRGKCDLAIRILVDFGELQAGEPMPCGPVDLAATGDENGLRKPRVRRRLATSDLE